MKNYFRVLSLLLVMGIFSCADNCEGIECGPGVCDDGTCDCPDGLEGTACEIISNTVLYGDYQVVSATCGTTSTSTTIESISINPHSNGNPTEIELTATSSSFSGPTTETIDGTLINGNIDAEGPFSSFTLEISGTFSDNDNFEATIIGAGLVCSNVTYTK